MRKIRECTYAFLLICLLAFACGCGNGNADTRERESKAQLQSTANTDNTVGQTGTAAAGENVDPDMVPESTMGTREDGDGVLDGLADDLRDGLEDVKDGVEYGVNDVMDGTSSTDVTSVAK